jgi:Holliday junction resolvase RusA-like endonuclease
MTITLTIPAPAKWLNSNDRMHWRPKAKLTKAWRQAAHVYARQAKLPKGLARVRIDVQVHKTTPNRYDAMNLYPTLKAVVDGLVDYGLVMDDNNDHVTGPFITDGGRDDTAKVVLTVTEILPAS